MNHAPLLLIQSDFERWVNVIADMATIVIALALIAVGLAVLYGAVKVRGMIRRVHADFQPAIRNVNAISDTAKVLTEKVRGNVEELSATVSDTNEKVRRATGAAEARLAELNALVGVAQREAEEAFLRAASTVRGVQKGTAALRQLAGRRDEEAFEDEEYEDELLEDVMMEKDEMAGREIEQRAIPPRRRGRSILD